MNPTIEKLLLQIAYVCLHITAQGKWHAFYNLSGHVERVDVYVYPADTNYQEPSERTLSAQASYRTTPEWASESEAVRHGEARDSLMRLLSALEPYLQPIQQEATA